MTVKQEKKLTVKQEKCCNKYVECGDKSKAYRFAYNTANMKSETVNVQAVKFFSDPKIATRVDELQKELKKKSDITKEKVLSELSKIAFSSIAHLHNTWIELKDFETLTEDQKASIKSISSKTIKKNIGTNDDPQIVDVEFVKIELYDKLKAIETLNKMQGFEAPTKVAQTDKEGNDVNFMTFLMSTNNVVSNE